MSKHQTSVTPEFSKALNLLAERLVCHKPLAVAISGGVDSMTLAAVAHQTLKNSVVMIHAVSPAVPADATLRVKQESEKRGWKLLTVDAQEFDDKDYIVNPVNRCYYCKSNLYNRMHSLWDGVVASGANLDDLGDYRPGLLAAKEQQVVHPLIEAGINKATVRRIAEHLGLDSVASLPAQPCLSSRIETGIAINADDLAFVYNMETMLSRELGVGDVRCRITAGGVRIEVEEKLQQRDTVLWESVRELASSMIDTNQRSLAGFSDYRRGSAFLTNTITVRKFL